MIIAGRDAGATPTKSFQSLAVNGNVDHIGKDAPT